MTTFLTIYDGVGLAAGVALILILRRRGAWLDPVGLGLLAIALAGAAWYLGRGFGRYGPLRFGCHGAFCVGFPVAMALGAVRLRRATIWALVLLASGTLAEGCYVWARWFEPFRLEVTRARVTSKRLAGLEEPIEIALLADLQTDRVGAFEEEVFARVREAEPDLVLLLGDYLQLPLDDPEFPQQRERFRALIQTLDPPLGIYAVNGDSERMYGKGDASTEWYSALFAGTKVQNAVRNTFVLPTEPPIQLHGLSPSLSRTNYKIDTARKYAEFDGFTITMGHAPDYMGPVIEGKAKIEALLVAGHTHGGQVVVPGLGPLITQTAVPATFAAGGVFRRDGAWLAVSRGIGMKRAEAPRVRFWCRPELMFLELAPE